MANIKCPKCGSKTLNYVLCIAELELKAGKTFAVDDINPEEITGVSCACGFKASTKATVNKLVNGIVARCMLCGSDDTIKDELCADCRERISKCKNQAEKFKLMSKIADEVADSDDEPKAKKNKPKRTLKSKDKDLDGEDLDEDLDQDYEEDEEEEDAPKPSNKTIKRSTRKASRSDDYEEDDDGDYEEEEETPPPKKKGNKQCKRRVKEYFDEDN